MFDLCKDCTSFINQKLDRKLLTANSYLKLIKYIFNNHRFSVIFCRKFSSLLDMYYIHDSISNETALNYLFRKDK